MKMKKRGLYLVIALLLLSFTYAQICNTNNTPFITSLDYFEIKEGTQFYYDINFTLEGESASLSWIPINFSISEFSISSTGDIKMIPSSDDRGIHSIFVITTTSEGCYDMKKISFKIINKPIITYASPERKSITIDEGQNILFRINATDNTEVIRYEWYMNNRLVRKDSNSFLFITNYSSSGEYDLEAAAFNLAGLNSTVSWKMDVNDVNRAPYVKTNIPDFVIAQDLRSGLANLNDYIFDADGDRLIFTPYFINSTGELINFSRFLDAIVNEEGLLYAYPKMAVTVVQHMKINASDGDKSILTEKFSVRIASKDEDLMSHFKNITIRNCEPRIECDEWQICLPNNIRVRECYDVNDCNSKNETLLEYEECDYGATCDDGIKNQGEDGVDCGGPCPPCPSCDDGIQNQGEEGIDCGGPCEPCESCFDFIKNQDETDVDCGGICKGCDPGKSCNTHKDCLELVCIDNICAEPTCYDFRQNQGEEGIDCGGPCSPCPTCNDGIQNQGEEDIDCGGPCRPCTSCDDGIKNQGEIFTDCGGPCECLWLDFLLYNKFRLIAAFFFLFLFFSVKSYISNNETKYFSFMSKIFSFLPSELSQGGKTAIETINAFKQLQYKLASETAEKINAEYTRISHEFFKNILEIDSVSPGYLKKQLNQKVKNPFIRKLVIKFYNYTSKEVSSSALYKIEMHQKITQTIARLNNLRPLIQNE